MKKLSILILIIASIGFAQKKPFSIEALYKIKNLSTPTISPDGSKALFTVFSSDMKKGKTYSDIYVMNTDGSNIKPLLNSDKNESSPIWIDDESFLYYLGGTLNMYSLESSKSTKVTDYNVSNPVISNDGNLLAFETEFYPECGYDLECNKKLTESSENGPVQAYIADELLYRHWTSFKEEREPYVVVLNLGSGEVVTAIKSDWISSNYMLGGSVRFNFSPDGTELCLMSTEEKNLASSTNADLYTVQLKNGEIKKITSNKSWDGFPVYSPDGKYIAFKYQQIVDFEADRYRIAVYDRTNSTIKSLTEPFDYTVDDMIWSDDSKYIFFTVDKEGYSPIYKVNPETAKIEEVSGKQSTFGFEIAGDNILFMSRTIEKPAELYLLNMTSKDVKQVSSFNTDFTNEYDIRPAEQVWIEGADGIKVHTFIIKPHNFDPNKKYPVVFNVHGGPQSQWMDAFRGDWQVYPGYGYVVVFCNPHGSTGYGSKYTEAISGDWGGKVYEDLMKVTDYIEKLPYVDKEKIGAMGWSYGGYMMNWFQAKTKRYKCLASMMGIFDLESMWGATEELWFTNWDLKGQPWNSEIYKKYSPSEYVKDFSTPALIITGERDYRVPYTQSVQYFTTLKTLGIDSRLVIFENDGHWPHSVKSMPLYYNAHLEWFHKYLGGEPAPYNSKDMVKNNY